MSVPSDVAKDVGNAAAVAVVATVAAVVAVAACRCCRASFSLISCSSSRSLLLSRSHAHGMEMRAFKLNCFKLAFLCFLVPMPMPTVAAAAAKTAATSGQAVAGRARLQPGCGLGTGLHLHWTMPPKQQSINPSSQPGSLYRHWDWARESALPVSRSVGSSGRVIIVRISARVAGAATRPLSKGSRFSLRFSQVYGTGRMLLRNAACSSSACVPAPSPSLSFSRCPARSLCIVCAAHKTRQICVFHMSRFARAAAAEPNKCRRCLA